jgi:hypothetical protein
VSAAAVLVVAREKRRKEKRKVTLKRTQKTKNEREIVDTRAGDGRHWMQSFCRASSLLVCSVCSRRVAEVQ